MDTSIKGYDLFWHFYNNNAEFKKIIDEGMESGKIRFFNETEWEKIESQNFSYNLKKDDVVIDTFIKVFESGYNIGFCARCSKLLSYSYNDVDIVNGYFPLLKGTLNSPTGKHTWLENYNSIIDTTLLLVIDKSLKEKLGYSDLFRTTSFDLNSDHIYQVEKDRATDTNLKRQ